MQRTEIAPLILLLASLPMAGCERPSVGSPPSPVPPIQKEPLSYPPSQAESPAFEDVAASAGLRYRWEISGPRPCNILQTIGNGCAFLDYNRDGNLDILLVGSHPALYQGDGKGHFTETTRITGIETLSGHFLGCAVGDYNNDGFSDIYLSAYRGGVLLQNEGGKRFRDVTRRSGLGLQPWGASCTFADLDRDGRLDLYIGNYVRFGPDTRPQLCDIHGFMTSCGPGDYTAEQGVFYRNRGNGQFEDRTRKWNLNTLSGKTLGVAAAPLDEGKAPVLALANDQVPGELLQFDKTPPKNQGVESGMAYAADGRVYGGMGVDWGDYDNDSQLDLIIATYQGQAKAIFHNQEGVFEAQDTTALGMISSVPYVSFGVKWLDFDNDGWLDLIFANGHVQDNVEEVEVMTPGNSEAKFRQPTILYRNQEGKRFADESIRLGGDAGRPIVGRGLATGDYDNDGRTDVLIADSDGTPLLLHNVTPKPGIWLLVDLTGRKSNRDAYGAIVTVEADGKKWVRHCHADGSYLSSSDKRVHFGLGVAKTATVTVRWPGGTVDTYRNVKANQVLPLKEK